MEQIHLDIQLRFHQKNDLKDFEISPNSRPLKFSLGSGSPGTVQWTPYTLMEPSIFRTVYFPPQQLTSSVVWIFIIFLSFSSFMIWWSSFICSQLFCSCCFMMINWMIHFHWQDGRCAFTFSAIETKWYNYSLIHGTCDPFKFIFLKARGGLREFPLFESIAPESQKRLHVRLLWL